MLGSADELVWLDTLRMKGLQLRFRRQEGRFVFDVAYRFHPKEGKVSELLAYEHKKYFSLMRYLVYHPLIWYLERSRGWTLLHASALDSVEGGINVRGLLSSLRISFLPTASTSTRVMSRSASTKGAWRRWAKDLQGSPGCRFRKRLKKNGSSDQLTTTFRRESNQRCSSYLDLHRAAI